MPVTYSQLFEEIKRLGRENPDHVYKPQGPCKYLDVDVDGSYMPGCIWGHAFWNLGLPVETVRDFNSAGIDTALDRLRNEGLVEADLPLQEFRKFAEFVQTQQDQGERWDNAVNLALEVYPVSTSNA